MDLTKAIKERKSVRRYSEKAPDWRDIIKAIDLARFAPMAGNQFNLKFILVRDEKKIARLAGASQQDFVGKAKYVVVVCSDVEKVKKSYDNLGEKFSHQQAGAAIQNFLLKLTDLDLATCWVGFFDDYTVRDALSIPSNITIEAMFPIGTETKIKTPEKKKADLENYIMFDKWGQKEMVPKGYVSAEAV